MVDYKESLVMLENMPTIIKQALSKEAAFMSKEEIERKKKERAEQAKKSNSAAGKGADDAKEFVRNTGNIRNDKDTLLDLLFKTQQKLNEILQPAKRIEQLKDELKFHEDSLEQAQTEYDKLNNQETANNKDKQLKLELEIKMQELMEESALVIIDFNKAIENGYIKLSEKTLEEFSNDYGDVEDE